MRVVQTLPSKKRSKFSDELFNLPKEGWLEVTPGEEGLSKDPEQARRSIYQAGRQRGVLPRTRIINGKVYLQRR